MPRFFTYVLTDLSNVNEFPAVKIQPFRLGRAGFFGGEILEIGDTRITMDWKANPTPPLVALLPYYCLTPPKGVQYANN